MDEGTRDEWTSGRGEWTRGRGDEHHAPFTITQNGDHVNLSEIVESVGRREPRQRERRYRRTAPPVTPLTT